MFNFLFKSATYYLIWKKFKQQIILVVLSALLISIISSIYIDLYNVLKIDAKESLIYLFLIKWFLISLIIALNIYKIYKVNVNKEEIEPEDIILIEESELEKNLKKYRSTTDVVLDKYKDKEQQERFKKEWGI